MAAGSSVEAGSKVPFRTEVTLMALDDVAGIGRCTRVRLWRRAARCPYCAEIGAHLPHVSFVLPRDLHGSSQWCRWREASSWQVHGGSPVAATI